MNTKKLLEAIEYLIEANNLMIESIKRSNDHDRLADCTDAKELIEKAKEILKGKQP